MIGKYYIEIENKKIRYKLEIKRKYTVLRGNSASGKTYLCNLVISDFKIINSNIQVSVLQGNDAEVITNTLYSVSNRVFIIDENNILFKLRNFEQILKNSDNYFILILRKDIQSLPISIKEEYTLKSSKYNNVENKFENIITPINIEKDIAFKDFDLVITEDSNSGNQFFKSKFGNNCVSSLGNSGVGIIKAIKKYKNNHNNIAIIVDGAVFQPYMNQVLSYCKGIDNVSFVLYTPESFEYLILSSGILNNLINIDIDEAYKYCDDNVFIETFKPVFKLKEKDSLISWERFYTAYLRHITSGDKDKAYNKSDLKDFYIQNYSKIIKVLR